MHLGSFAAAKRELEAKTSWDDFNFCGEKFVITGDIPAMLMLQLAASTSGKVAETEGLTAMWEAFRTALGEKAFSKFYKLAVENAVEIEDIMKVVLALFEAQDGRPTVQASASGSGLPATSPSSSSLSTHPALAHLTPVADLVG